mmetsp:Transcript_3607/g.11152  ORF Transcript_3607/g.11152 Transcript_3607/m.11152 type:complete len:122 (-) Transcript_3607:573-938(-)
MVPCDTALAEQGRERRVHRAAAAAAAAKELGRGPAARYVLQLEPREEILDDSKTPPLNSQLSPRLTVIERQRQKQQKQRQQKYRGHRVRRHSAESEQGGTKLVQNTLLVVGRQGGLGATAV